MSSVQFHMSDAVQRGAEHGMRIGMEAAMKSVLEEVVNKLSEKYEFDAEDEAFECGAERIGGRGVQTRGATRIRVEREV